MDKDFKKIFDKLIKEHYIEEDTAKVLTMMDAYQEFLDKAVEKDDEYEEELKKNAIKSMFNKTEQ